MTFGAPNLLWLLAVLPLMVLLFALNESKRKTLIGRIVAARLQSNLAGNTSTTKRWLRFVLFLVGIAGLIVSLAQPRYGFTWEETKRKGHDLIIAIDTSKSMLSTDIAPDRLTRAKLAAQDLVNLLPGDRVGLVAFAGSAFLQAPLTVDYTAVLSSINELDTNIIPRGGTDIAEAIRLATDAFGKGESENRVMVLFTDGEDLDSNTLEAAKRAAGNFKIFTVGVGSKEGSLIPVPEESGGTNFVKDPGGNIVKSHLDEERLRQIADITGGFYVHLGSDPAAMKRIVNEGLGSVKEREIDAKQARKPIERYQWPLAFGLLFLILSFLISERVRKLEKGVSRAVAARAMMLLVLFFLLLPMRAFSKTDGLESYKQGKYDEAFSAFDEQLKKNPSSPELNFNLGTASYKKKEYSKALGAFSNALVTKDPDLKTKAEYNFGNTLFQQAGTKEQIPDKIGALKNAVQHYDSALLINPKHEEAKENKEAALRWIKKLEEQQKEQQQKKDQQDQKKDDKKDQDKKNQDQKDQGKKDQNQDQKDQKKNDSQKDQQKDQQGQDQQQKGDQQKQDQQDKQKQGDSKQDQKNQQGSQDQQKDQGQQGKDGKNKEDNSNQPNANPSPSPSNNSPDASQGGDKSNPQAQPTPTPGETPSGEIKAQPSQEKQNEPQNAQAGVAQQGDKPGELSEQQAEALLQSLANDEAHVILNERKPAAPVLKDW